MINPEIVQGHPKILSVLFDSCYQTQPSRTTRSGSLLCSVLHTCATRTDLQVPTIAALPLLAQFFQV